MSAAGFRLRWLGQSGFLIEYAGSRALLDPYLSDSLTKKYANTGRPHIRMKPIVVDPATLTGIEVVTSSHNHTDHLDAETLLPIMRANPEMKLIAPAANRAFVAERLGCDEGWIIGLEDRESARVGSFCISAVPACHEEVAPEYHGYVVQAGDWTIYHSGDTLLYDGMAERLREFGRIDVALLPINGRAPERRVAGNLNAREAAQLGRDIGARTVIPCHYDMFTFNTADPADFAAAARAIGQPYHIMELGGWWDSTQLEEAHT